VVAQVVYYFKGWLLATSGPGQKVSFCVPSGNFGNVCAGHIARMMGLPIDKLVVATNENDVLDEFFRTGTYRVRTSAQTYHTSSPSMDISKASNFERFVFDLLGQDADKLVALFRDVDTKGGFDLAGTPEFARIGQFGFVSGRSTHRPSGDDPRREPALWRDDRHPHRRRREGGARAPAAGRADGGAGNRAAGQVRRHHPRGAGP
jgi:threonine synthase